jgi:hypothetical protein
MTIFALTVGHNEEHRYLRSMLANVREWTDVHFFYDDRSDDETYNIAFRSRCITYRRSLGSPSFAENEGEFRGRAWQAFEAVCTPREGDWVLVIDCDEMLVGDGRPVGEALDDVLCSVEKGAVDLNIPEVFGFDSDGCPLVRVDGLWGTIHAPRLFTYRSGGSYFPGKVGVPAVPSYVMAAHWESTSLISLMHFGYAKEIDQIIKFNRYFNQPGHLEAHVKSIMTDQKQLVRWEYPLVGNMHYRG